MAQRDDAPLPLPPLPAPPDKPHIYVVNSDPAFLDVIADLLEDTRAEFTLEEMRPNVAITLENLRTAKPDLLILDMVPFRTDAQLLLELIATDEQLAHLPIILASTNPAMAEQLAEQHAQHVRDILPKPFDLELFYTKLHQIAGVIAR